MKKILLLMVGMLVAFASQAQLYLVGPGVGNDSWTPNDPVTVQAENGWYTFEVTPGSEFQMSKAKGDWGVFNGSILGRSTDWSGNVSDGLQSCSLTTQQVNHKFSSPAGFKYVRVNTAFNKVEWSTSADFSGGSQGGDDTDLTFYFYDRNGENYTDVYAYVYGNGVSLSGPTQMTSTGKYVLVNGEYCPVWSFTPSAAPTNVMFTKDSGWGNKITSSEPAYVKGGFYYVSGSSVVSETGLKLVDKVEDTYTFTLYQTNGTKLGDFSGENPYAFTYNISEPLGADVPLCVRRIKNGNEADHTIYRLSTSFTYDGTNGGDKAMQENGGAIVLKKALQGAVTFALTVADNVPTTINILGGHIETSGEDGQYTIYFYDQNNVGTEIYAHIWRKAGNGDGEHIFKTWGSKDPAIKFAETGKYIRTSAGKYCPLFKLTFSWDLEPTHIIVYNGERVGTKKYTDNNTDVPFLNNGFYTNGSTTGEADRDIVDEPESVTLYMHFKEDLIFEAKGGENADTWCHILNGDTFINGSTRDDAHKMRRVSEKYQIYAYTMTPEEALNGNNVEFSFQNTNGTYATFRATGAEHFNQERWTDFIYSTARRNNTQYAIQTYMSYQKFREVDAAGRPCAYLVGDPNGAIQGLSWEPADPVKYVNEDGPCFYIPLTILGTKTTIFKISWVDVKTEKENATEGFTDSARDWATYDLGIVGVAAREQYPAGSVDLSNAIKDGKDFGQDIKCTVFGINTSLKYNNFNQYNFVVDGTKMVPGTYYLVIDTHAECRTVTLVDFDPNPSVEIEHADVKVEKLNAAQAKSLHRHYNHLDCAATNGHIYMDKVNTCSGSMLVKGSSGLDIDNAGYDIEYTITMNGNDVVQFTGKPGRIDLDYMPLTAENDLVCRAKYTDKEREAKVVDGKVVRVKRNGTGLTFHSRRGAGKVEIPAEIAAPQAQILNAKYAMGYAGVYGVLVDAVDMSVETTHSVYGDLSFTIDSDPTVDKRRRMQLLHANHPIAKAYETSVLEGWTPLVENWSWEDPDNATEPENPNEDSYDFDGGIHDWSTKMLDPNVTVPLFISRYTAISDASLLENKTLEGEAHAIYPFLYEVTPNITVVPDASKAPARAASVASLPDDLSGFALSQFTRSTPITYDLAASGSISGVEDVIGDADADAEAEYYTISGIRVMGQPTPGIYLCRKGDKVTKVVVR